MAEIRYHLKEDMTLGVCNPKVTNVCGLKGEGGEDAFHGTLDEVESEIARRMSDSVTPQVMKKSSPNPKMAVAESKVATVKQKVAEAQRVFDNANKNLHLTDATEKELIERMKRAVDSGEDTTELEYMLDGVQIEYAAWAEARHDSADLLGAAEEDLRDAELDLRSAKGERISRYAKKAVPPRKRLS